MYWCKVINATEKIVTCFQLNTRLWSLLYKTLYRPTEKRRCMLRTSVDQILIGNSGVVNIMHCGSDDRC